MAVGPYFQEVLNWWKNLLTSSTSRVTTLPFRRLIRRAGLDPSEGVLRWGLEEQTAKRLDQIARSAGATHFVVRLAAFAALIADITGQSRVAIGTFFDGRDRVETQNIVGRFANSALLVFTYDASKTFLEWLQIVRDRVFETKVRSGLPYHMLLEQLRAVDVEPPGVEIVFMLSSDHSDQHFGGLTVCNDFWSAGTMPGGCILYIDEKKSENCRVNFDAGFYNGNEMRAMLNRYLRLLEAAAREPELPIGKLQKMTGTKPLRWACERYARAFYDSSPLLKTCWRHARRWRLVDWLTGAGNHSKTQ
jgi:hypothetical protein